MGMPREGHATPDKKAPGLGRNLKLESQRTWRTPMVPCLRARPTRLWSLCRDWIILKIPGMDKGAMRVMGMPELNQAPLFPQDAFMEGSMMAMDKGSGQTRDVWVARRLDRICWTHDYTGVESSFIGETAETRDSKRRGDAGATDCKVASPTCDTFMREVLTAVNGRFTTRGEHGPGPSVILCLGTARSALGSASW
jgi:hypothetical protein